MSDTQKSSWSSEYTKATSSQNKEERRRSYFSMALTILLAVAIIITGFVTPGLFYSIVDSDRGTITPLSDSTNGNVRLHVFDEPVSLYPWNLYNEANTSDLSYAERGFLIEHNVPSFLITTLSAYGLDIEQYLALTGQPTEALTGQIVDSFSFLLTDPETGQGCYVIYAMDINKDGTPDLRCAVDQSGVIISQIILSTPWLFENGTTEVVGDQAAEAPPVEVTPPAGATGGEGANAAAVVDTAPAENAATVPNENGEVGVTGDSYALNLEGLEVLPVGEELSLWSYTHLIALSASANGQLALSEAASILDAGFNEKYANPEAASEDLAYAPVPTIFTTEEFTLYIYDLPTNVRFILYYDASQSRCVGFNVQL